MDTTLRVLVVEDSPSDTELILRQLRRSGYAPVHQRVETAETMSAALDLEAWDIVISDARMPRFDASSALSLLQQSESDIPFIVVSGAIGEETAVALMKAGANDYVMKASLPLLGSAVARALAEAEDRRSRIEAEVAVKHKNMMLAGMNRILNQDPSCQSEEELGLACLAVAEEITDSRLGFIGLIDDDGNLKNIAVSNPGWDLCRVLDRDAPLEADHREGLCGRILRDGIGILTNAPGDHPDWIGLPEGHPPLESFLGVGLRNDAGIIGLAAIGNRPGGYRRQDLETLETLAPVIAEAFLRRQAEQARKKSEALLFQSQKMEAVGRLAGGIAHDFNNILFVFLGYSDLLSTNMQGDHPFFEPLREMRSAAERARKLTHQLMAFSRKQVLETHEIDLNRLIADFEQMIRRVLGEDIEIVLRPAPEAVLTKADRTQLEQVLMNLAVNARDAMPDGGRLIIETAMADLHGKYLAARPYMTPGNYCRITFSDTGAGILPEHLDHIFEPFFTTKAVDKGTGLGLATSYGIVKQHGGSILVYSEPNLGTTFRIYLPASRGEAHDAARAAACPVAADRPATVLLVEDDTAVRKLTEQILTTKGYCVLSCGSPGDAVTLAGRYAEPIHLLLTDVIMPGMKGPEVYHRISRFHPTIKVVYMSGYADDIIAQQGVLEEGECFIQKPFVADELVKKINEVLH